MSKILKQIKQYKSLLPFHANYWTISESKVTNNSVNVRYYKATNYLLYPFAKPISKIINLENAPLESK